MDRNSPLREIKGVGAKTEELFHKIGVYTVGDIPVSYTHLDVYKRQRGNRGTGWRTSCYRGN